MEAGDEDEEATTNRTDLKWIHEVEGREGLLDENEVWVRRSALIKGLSCINMSLSIPYF